ncbi:TIM-barrel signal transduction protein-domain-containing protein [Tuber indicum]|nr:TIM-barrel signal transduction protein-domain-containing protein [Tuber indicum]
MVQHTPVLAGVRGADPFPSIPRFLMELQNFPTNLEETGMGFSLEQAVDMVLVGAEVIIAHIGLTTKGSISAGTAPTYETALNLDGCMIRIQEIRNAAVVVRSDVSVVYHGAPISEVGDVDYVLERRLPIEVALEKTVKDFKGITIKDPSARGN